MKKIINYLLILLFLSSCMTKKGRHKNYEDSDSLAMTKERIKENKDLFVEHRQETETTTTKEFDDTLEASIYVDSLQSDTIESKGIKIITQTKKINGKLKTKITVIAKPKKVTDVIKTIFAKDSIVKENRDIERKQISESKKESKIKNIDKKTFQFPWWILVIIIIAFLLWKWYKKLYI
jgi:hypothetical protein